MEARRMILEIFEPNPTWHNFTVGQLSRWILGQIMSSYELLRVKEYFPSTNTFRAVLLGSLVYNINVHICVNTLGNHPRIMIQLKYS